MNILIVSNFFTPNNCVASFRIEAFAKYFREAGHSAPESDLSNRRCDEGNLVS